MRIIPFRRIIPILEFICATDYLLEVIVFAQRVALISPDYKLNNMKNNIGKFSQGKERTARSNFRPTFLAFFRMLIYPSHGVISLMSTSFSLTWTRTPAFPR